MVRHPAAARQQAGLQIVASGAGLGALPAVFPNMEMTKFSACCAFIVLLHGEGAGRTGDSDVNIQNSAPAAPFG